MALYTGICFYIYVDSSFRPINNLLVLRIIPMNVISDKNEILNSSVSIQEIDGSFGLVMESRGGAKGKSNERNTDYSIALDTILKRLNGICQ